MKHLFENETHSAIEKDVYQDLFQSVIYVYNTFRERGCLSEYFDEERIKTIGDMAKRLLITAIQLLCNGVDIAYFNTLVEKEFTKYIFLSDANNKREVIELALAGHFAILLRSDNASAIYANIMQHCSEPLRTKLLPSIDGWGIKGGEMVTLDICVYHTE